MYPDRVRRAVKEIRKIERQKPLSIIFTLLTNGDNPDNILSLIDDGYIANKSSVLSYDGVDDIFHHYSELGIKKLSSHMATVATALDYRSMMNIEDTLDKMILYGTNSWEYYYLIDNKEYYEKEFLDIFRDDFLPTVYKYSDSLKINNIDRIKDNINKPMYEKQLWCNQKNTLDISIDGYIYPCGLLTDACKYNTIDITGIALDSTNKEIEEYLVGMKRKYCMVNTCNYKDCKAYHCRECNICNISKHRFNQQCALRQLELDAYQKYIY